MNKSNTKTKLTLVSSAKKRKIGAPLPANKEAVINEPLEQLATVEFWKQEIGQLKAEKFESVSEATERLIDQVLERLKLKQQGEDDIKEFLRLVFESSEILQSTLRNSLGLK